MSLNLALALAATTLAEHLPMPPIKPDSTIHPPFPDLSGRNPSDTPEVRTSNPLKARNWRNDPRLKELLAEQARQAEVSKEIRAQNLSAKELNFRRRLPKGHPDRIESK